MLSFLNHYLDILQVLTERSMNPMSKRSQCSFTKLLYCFRPSGGFRLSRKKVPSPDQQRACLQPGAMHSGDFQSRHLPRWMRFTLTLRSSTGQILLFRIERFFRCNELQWMAVKNKTLQGPALKFQLKRQQISIHVNEDDFRQ